MDDIRFDALSRLVDGVGTRRVALRTALAGVVAVGVTAAGSAVEAKKKKKKKCKKCKALAADASCSTNKQCCTNETNRACAVAENASNNDTTCCGALNAVCGGINDDLDTVSPFCCAEFACNVTSPNVQGTCQPVTVVI